MANVVQFSASIPKSSDNRGTLSEPEQEFLDTMLKRFKLSMDAEAALRELMEEDLDFYSSEQWDEDVRADRTADGKPSLTINRLPQFVRQVTNQARASRPSIQVNPIDSGSDPKVAEAVQGCMRSIEVNSDADIAYGVASEHQAICGRGWFRILTEYAYDDGYEQNIVFRPVEDPLSVAPDPTAPVYEPHRMRFCFTFEDMPKDAFIDQYGEDAAAEYTAWAGSRDRAPEWMPEGRIRVSEYFYVVSEFDTVVDVELPALQGPGTDTVHCLESSLPPKSEMPDNWKIKNKRQVERRNVYWAKVIPTRVLDGNEEKTAGRRIPGRYIPVVPVVGDVIVNGGKRDIRGMVRDAKDPQRMYSYWASCLTEIITQAPRAPYVGFEGQFAGHEAKWNRANRDNFAYLETKAVMLAGQIAPLPQRQQYDPAIQSIVQAFQLADNDLKAVMGLFDASLGESGPEQSGKAILARQRQGEMGNSNFLDNLGRAIRYGGRIILSMIPEIYAPSRIIKILGADEKPQDVILHNGLPDTDVEAMRAATGVEKIYDIGVGRYDVSISVGPSYLSRRQEAVSSMLELIKAYPEAGQVVADLLVKNMDWPGAAEVAARLKKIIPGNLLPADDPDHDPVPPQMKEQMQQVMEAYRQLKQQLDSKILELKSEESRKMAELSLQAQTAKMQQDTAVITAQMKLDYEGAMQRLNMDLQQTQSRLDVLQAASEAAAQREHEAEQAIQQREHEADMAKQQQEHEAQQQAAQPAADPGSTGA